MMLVIFAFSSRADNELPDFEAWDYIVKKCAHAVVYGLLALSYLRMLPGTNYKLAWLFAVIYAVTDEYHQSFVPGRNPSVIDILVFDNFGAMIGLFVHYRFYEASHEKEIH